MYIVHTTEQPNNFLSFLPLFIILIFARQPRAECVLIYIIIKINSYEA